MNFWPKQFCYQCTMMDRTWNLENHFTGLKVTANLNSDPKWLSDRVVVEFWAQFLKTLSLSENHRDCSFKKIVSPRDGAVTVRTNIWPEKAAKKAGQTAQCSWQKLRNWDQDLKQDLWILDSKLTALPLSHHTSSCYFSLFKFKW